MQVIRLLKYWLPVALLTGCIEPFNPDIEESKELLVISGKITNLEGYHYLEISWSTSYDNPVIVREKNCSVSVYDDKGNVFQYQEYLPGFYRCWFAQEYLSVGNRFRVEVVTKEGKTYASGFDEMKPCPGIENITYEAKTIESDDPFMNCVNGIQLYIYTEASEDDVTNLKWEIDETWEYHASYLISDYFDGTINFMEGMMSDSLFVCFKNGRVKDMMTMSTRNYASNKINKGPLTFVADNKEKLQIKYSALVRQFSLSDSAFEFWNKMQQNLQDAGGLYDAQPIRIIGNIRCVSDPEERVLGYFWATEIKEKRFFFRNTGEIPFDFYKCQPYDYTPEQLEEHLRTFTEDEYPIYLINESGLAEGPWDLTDQECFDCTKGGGTLERPEFWQ
ncbi:MAG: DUF4249 domain-containing protein [Bacteroidales bacterium]|nr:DUF4249 domain-containing protein [Bacteroidales bacterium]